MSTILCHTDGSCLGNGSTKATGTCAAAIFTSNDDYIYKKYRLKLGNLIEKVTNNTAELCGVKIGLDLCLDHVRLNKIEKSHWTIETDSKYSIGVLSGETRANVNKKLINSIIQLMADCEHKCNCTIEFNWVKGHDTNKGNILVDRLCKD